MDAEAKILYGGTLTYQRTSPTNVRSTQRIAQTTLANFRIPLRAHLLVLHVAVLGLIANAARGDWVGGRDLAANERPNGPQELGNPNPMVPRLSYGHRPTISGTALTRFLRR